MFNGIIYRTINLANGKWFIGSDANNDPKYLGDGLLLRRDIKKYGRKKFRKEILCWANSAEELAELEHKLIVDYDAYSNPASYNITLVAEAEAGFSKLLQAEASALRAGQWKKLSAVTQEQVKQAVSDAHRGKPKSAQHKELISKALRGRPKPKTSQSLKQYWDSESAEQMRIHLRAVCGRSGEQNGFYGHTHSEQTRARISSAKQGKANIKKRKLSAEDVELIHQLHREGVSKSDLAKQFGVSKPTVTRCFKQSVK